MAESRLRRAARSLRDPWSLLAASVGAGAAWALALPVAGIGAVGVGMLGVAAVAGALTAARDASPPAEPELVPGTVQYRSVHTLESYLGDLTHLRGGPVMPLLQAQAADAVQAATSARTVAVTVARSVDQLDVAIARATAVARQMTTGDRVGPLVQRMQLRRAELLAKLATAVDGVGELYARLLELTTTADVTSELTGGPAVPAPDPVAEVNFSLDAIRQAFAELQTDATGVSAQLTVPDDRRQPPSF
jgi:hypothetical protein